MKRENALFIASILEEELKAETRDYNERHNMWVESLIEATKDLFDTNGFCRWELNRLIKEYCEAKGDGVK